MTKTGHAALLAAAVFLAAGLVRAETEGLRVESWPIDEATSAALVEDHRAPLVSLRLVFPAGDWSPWFRRVHADDAFAVQMFDSKGELRRRADALGAGISVSNGDRTSVLSASCLKEDLPALLALARDVLANRDFDRKELRRWAQEQKLEWSASQKNTDFRASQAAARLLYAEDDPRRREYEKPERIEDSPQRLAEARDAVIRLPGRVVAFAGDLTRAEASRAAKDLLPPAVREVPEDLEPRFDPFVSEDRRPRDVDVRMPRLTQVYFSLVRDMIALDDPDYPAYVIANHVLGGHFYSRLYRALRHEGGDTYGAGSGGSGDTVPEDYGLYTFTRAGNEAEAEAKLRETLRVFHEKGITESERADAASNLLGHRPFLKETPSQVLSRWLNERTLGLPPGFFDALVDRAASLPLEDVNRFIERFHDPAKFTMVRVVPE